jgi:hypothetical protein
MPGVADHVLDLSSHGESIGVVNLLRPAGSLRVVGVFYAKGSVSVPPTGHDLRNPLEIPWIRTQKRLQME